MSDPTFEPVGYRYRPPESADPREWRLSHATEADEEYLDELAERGWQVERLYRRESDTEVEGEGR